LSFGAGRRINVAQR